MMGIGFDSTVFSARAGTIQRIGVASKEGLFGCRHNWASIDRT